jgi:hypothetical protein
MNLPVLEGEQDGEGIRPHDTVAHALRHDKDGRTGRGFNEPRSCLLLPGGEQVGSVNTDAL